MDNLTVFVLMHQTFKFTGPIDVDNCADTSMLPFRQSCILKDSNLPSIDGILWMIPSIFYMLKALKKHSHLKRCLRKDSFQKRLLKSCSTVEISFDSQSVNLGGSILEEMASLDKRRTTVDQLQKNEIGVFKQFYRCPDTRQIAFSLIVK